MLIIEPDFDRRIDLPGVGPCRRPVDIDQARIGLSKLVSLRVYSFDQGMVIDGEAEGDEVFITLMRGRADIAVNDAGKSAGEFALTTAGGTRAIYLPPSTSYRLAAIGDCDIAYARVAAAAETREARGFAPSGDRLLVPDYAAGMELMLATVPAGEGIAIAAADGSAPERFVHVRSDDDGLVAIDGRKLPDWGSAVLEGGERATATIEKGAVDILTISASAQ